MNIDRRSALMLGLTAGVGALTTLPKKDGDLYKLGLNPTPEGSLRLSDYLVPSELPPLPTGDFGHQTYISDWKLLGNGQSPDNPHWAPDGVGDCAIVAPYHAEMLFNAVAGRSINVDTNTTIKAYSDIAGYVPGVPSTDKGSNMVDVAEYWRTTGLKDADGVVHKIDAYVELNGLREILYGIYLFDCVGLGISLPAEWEQAFGRGSTWEALPTANILGGHAILAAGYVSGYLDTITWGQQQLLSPAGLRQFGNTAMAYLSRERLLASGKDLNGFLYEQLLEDFQELPEVA